MNLTIRNISDAYPGHSWLRGKPFVAPPKLIVLHATDGTGVEGSIETLEGKGLAYHYIIERTPEKGVVKCAKLSEYVSHAGSSYGPLEQAKGRSTRQDRAQKFGPGISVNPYSIGISFANYETNSEKLTGFQIDACVELVKTLTQAMPTLAWITRHLDVSPGRKTDPKMLGEADYARIATAGALKVWRQV